MTVTQARLAIIVLTGSVSILSLMLLAVPGTAAGPVLVDALGHGLHQNDVPVLGVWGLALGVAVIGWRHS